MKKEMLINVLQPEESRIAIVEDGVLEELYVERTTHLRTLRPTRLPKEPQPSCPEVRHGFLHVSDVEYQYFKHLLSRKGGNDDRGGNGKRGR